MSAPADAEPELVKARWLVEQKGLSRSDAYALVARLGPIKIGRSVYVERAAVDAYLESLRSS